MGEMREIGVDNKMKIIEKGHPIRLTRNVVAGVRNV